MKTFLNSQFLKVQLTKINLFRFFKNKSFFQSIAHDRQLAAEIHLPGNIYGGVLNVTQEQYRTIMLEAIGCI